jgi:DNA-binding NtrC family response regulator
MIDRIVEPGAVVEMITPDIKVLFSNLLLELPIREARAEFERIYFMEKVKSCDGKVSKLAPLVGMERTHLYRKLRALGIPFK